MNPSTSTAKISTPVRYRPAPFKPGRKGVLEWTQDDSVRLVVAGENGLPEVIVEAAIPRIQEFVVARRSIRLMVDTTMYNLEIVGGLIIGGPFGIAQAIKAEKTSGVEAWVRELPQKGVRVRYFGMKWVLKASLVIVGSVIIIAFIQSQISK